MEQSISNTPLHVIGKTGYTVFTCKKGKPDTLMKWLKRYESRIIDKYVRNSCY